MLKNFICATTNRGTLTDPLPAPLFRREFCIQQQPERAVLRICGLGLYRVYVNGSDITKGVFAPYISNTDQVVYVDEYDVTQLLRIGDNALCVILGNGYQNALGGTIWELDTASFQSAPKLAFELVMDFPDGTQTVLHADETTMTAPSPITFNDWWCGEYYDARLASDWLSEKSQRHDPRWQAAKPTYAPIGTQRISDALPIRIHEVRAPVSITPVKTGYLYDFGVNDAGSFILNVPNSTPGQQVKLSLGEHWDGAQFNTKKLFFVPEELAQVDRYICRGDAQEFWQPMFVYHGYRYILVEGITPAQATKDLLHCLVIHSDLKERGQFQCSDPILEKIQEITRRALLCNFYFYPTDCPQREKHGWTDAGQWAEAVFMNWAPERSYQEWMVNVRAAQSPEGMFPGVVPMGDWGMNLGGPYWDAVIVNIPWLLWKHRGNLRCFIENKDAVLKYVRYLSSVRNEQGLISFGIGDWCPVGKIEPRDFKSPIVVTDTAISFDICAKAAKLFAQVGETAASEEAQALANALRQACRDHLIDWNTLTVDGNCQTSQAAFLYYRIFDESERLPAAKVLANIVRRDDEFMDVGCIGGRILFHALSEVGESALAYRMISRPEFPSFYNWLLRGATTLWEDFQVREEDVCSRNHPMWGDISNWMYQWVAGLQVNPDIRDCNEVVIRPGFSTGIQSAQAQHNIPNGQVKVQWTQRGAERNILISFRGDCTIWLQLEEPGSDRIPIATAGNRRAVLQNFQHNGNNYTLLIQQHS